MSTPAATRANGHGDDLDAIRAEIEAVREQLGRTVDEIDARLDVPARARESAVRAEDAAVETYRGNPPPVIGTAVALVCLFIGMVISRRKRAESRTGRGRTR